MLQVRASIKATAFVVALSGLVFLSLRIWSQVSADVPIQALNSTAISGCTQIPTATFYGIVGPTSQSISGINYISYRGSMIVAPQGNCTSHNYGLSLRYKNGSFPDGWLANVKPATYNPVDLKNTHNDTSHVATVDFTISIPSNTQGDIVGAQLLNAITPIVSY